MAGGCWALALAAMRNDGEPKPAYPMQCRSWSIIMMMEWLDAFRVHAVGLPSLAKFAIVMAIIAGAPALDRASASEGHRKSGSPSIRGN